MISQDVVETAEKIRSMKIRGAGEIGRSAAMALKSCAETSKAETAAEFLDDLNEAGDLLISARPSAVSLPNAVRFISYRLYSGDTSDLKSLQETVLEAADEFVENSNKALTMIGEIGARRIGDGDTLLTHCNSSAAISIIKSAWGQGKDIKVFATEARPRYQGYITVKELVDDGIPTTLIVDSAVRTFMKEIDKVIVGADSIASNGAVVNKIGTSQIALAAHEARVLFLVAAETYKFHPETLVGELVEIEERSTEEIVDPEEFKGVTIRNPAFDVTPPEYVDLIITEKGAIPPQAAIMIIKEEFGWAIPSI